MASNTISSCRRQGYVGKLMQAAIDAARHQMRLTF
ncbi:MAG: N-acetyltransferase [Megasphaera massiliensis]|nr:N-acetyltransferase [Megasphaera massiliensis]MCQ5210471.1 N-acetyltransferase [Megasphaera massiliensis]MEE0659377.1 N-acetyltransferase [Megasphaera massiliensis]